MIGIKEAKRRLNISDSTIRRWIKDGVIPHYKLGGRLKFKEEDIDAYIAANLVKTKSEALPTEEPMSDHEGYITIDELAAVNKGIEDIKQGKYVTLEEYRSGKRP